MSVDPAPDALSFNAWKAAKLHLVQATYQFVPTAQMVEDWKSKHSGTSVLTLEVGDLVEVTDFSTNDWWTGIKQDANDDQVEMSDHHGGKTKHQTMSFGKL